MFEIENVRENSIQNENIRKHNLEINKTDSINNEMYTDDERKHTTKRERTGSFLRKEVFQDVVINVKDSDLAKFKSVKVYNNDYVRSQNFNIYAEQSYPYILPEYTPETRNLFVKCVLLMVLTMFTFSGILVMYVLITPDVRNFLSENVLNALFISLSVFLFVDYAFVCAECARIGPCNFVCLTVTVLTLSATIATISAALQTEILLYAILATTLTVLVGVFLSCTKFDFKSYMLYVVLLGTSFGAIVLIVLGIVLVNKIFVDALWLIILLVITFIQVVLLTMQLQQIIKGASVEFKEDDYALASFMLYASVIDIFIKMCQIAGITRDMSDRR